MARKDYNYYKKPENIDLVAAYSGSSEQQKPSGIFETPEATGFDRVSDQTSNGNDELIEELFQYYDDIDCAVTVDQRITAKEQAELWLVRLIEAKDAEREKAVEEARKDAYEHAEIVRQRTLLEIRQAVEDDESYGGAEELVYKIIDSYLTPPEVNSKN